MSKRPLGERETRLVKAVQRKPAAAVANVETRRVKAVKRRAARLLPAALLEANALWFSEVSRLNFTGNDYEIGLGPRSPELLAESRLHVFRGWRYDFTEAGVTRFSMSRKSQLLVFAGLKVFDAEKKVLGEFHQRATGFSVHFDVVDAAGTVRLSVRQPADVWTEFTVWRGDRRLAELFRCDRPGSSLFEADRVVDAFRLEFHGPTDEVDRALIIAAGIFLDRLYFSRGDRQLEATF